MPAYHSYPKSSQYPTLPLPKPAKLSTGIEIQVPEYITTGEKIVVNTTTGEFAGRA